MYIQTNDSSNISDKLNSKKIIKKLILNKVSNNYINCGKKLLQSM